MKTYGIKHERLIARAQPNRRDSSKMVAFIGKQLCFFERDSAIPAEGEEVEVMITRPLYARYPENHKWAGSPDRGKIIALMIEVVDQEKHVLVAIEGFECSGSMCRTLANGRPTEGHRALTAEEMYPPRLRGESVSTWNERTRGAMWLTPGRCDIFVAENVNARFDRREPTPIRPTNVWVSRAEYEEKSGCGVRVGGLTRIEDGTWGKLVRTDVTKAA